MAEKKKSAWWMITNSGGKKDVALTLMIVSFTICCLLAIVGAFGEIEVGDLSITFNEFNMGFATTVLIPIVGLYFGRRYTDVQAGLYKTQELFALNKKEESTEEDA